MREREKKNFTKCEREKFRKKKINREGERERKREIIYITHQHLNRYFLNSFLERERERERESNIQYIEK